MASLASFLEVSNLQVFNSFMKKVELGSGVNNFIRELVSSKGIPISKGNGYPRYLYHFTNQESASSIFEKGILEARTIDQFQKGAVYSVDLCNILSSYKEEGVAKLLKQAQKKSDTLTLLRIPVNKLNKDILKLRDIDRVTIDIPAEGGIVINKIMKKYNCKSHDELLNLAQIDNAVYNELMCKLEPYFGCSIGRNAGNFNLYRGKKQPIEFMYPDNIGVDCIEEIGTVNIEALKKRADYDELRPTLSILRALLKGHPEEKSLVRLNV